MAVEPGLTPRYRALPAGWQAVLVVFSAAGLLLAINQLFNLNFFAGYVLLENRYLYLLLALFFSLIFLIIPPTARSPRDRVPWYDAVLWALAIAAPCYYAWNGLRILEEAWDFRAPTQAVVVGVVLWLLVLEGARRAGGIALFVLVALFSLYPVVAGQLPGPISGFDLGFADTIRYHAMSVEAILGIPMRVFGTLIIGFIVFGEALQVTGGGRFFNDVAMAMLGAFRGGPAKVSVVASGLFGSMSGSVVSNIVADGAITIPMMKRMGFRGEVAAAVEATASTGGALTPPVMGATAFVMASILGISYVDVAIAAAIPSILFYVSLYFQVDAYSARHGLRGLPRVELPRFGPTLRAGWFFVLTFVLLVFLLISLRREAHAPFFATALLLALAMIRADTRFTVPSFVEFVASVGRVLAELVTILAAVGLIIGALAVTGVAGTFSSDMIRLAGGSVPLLLVLGALACFVLGMGMTMTAAYVFLAVVMAPALVQQGLNAVAVHLFIMYWAMLSFITPPVAIGAFAAASIAHCSAMRTGFEAMRFGAVKYILPFFFVYNPALVAQDTTALELVWVFAGAALGVGLLSYGLQGYALGLGTLSTSAAGLLTRGLFVVAGILLAAPEPITDVLGLVIAAVTYAGLLAVPAVRTAAVASASVPATR
jgi:TRAP transporter 4TM/12TM fusion protein